MGCEYQIFDYPVHSTSCSPFYTATLVRRLVFFFWTLTLTINEFTAGGIYYVQFTVWSLVLTTYCFSELSLLSVYVFARFESTPPHSILDSTFHFRLWLLHLAIAATVPFEVGLSVLYWAFGLYAFTTESEYDQFTSVNVHGVVALMWVTEVYFGKMYFRMRHIVVPLALLVIYSIVHVIFVSETGRYIYRPIQLRFGILLNFCVFCAVVAVVSFVYWCLHKITTRSLQINEEGTDTDNQKHSIYIR